MLKKYIISKNTYHLPSDFLKWLISVDKLLIAGCSKNEALNICNQYISNSVEEYIFFEPINANIQNLYQILFNSKIDAKSIFDYAELVLHSKKCEKIESITTKAEADKYYNILDTVRHHFIASISNQSTPSSVKANCCSDGCSGIAITLGKEEAEAEENEYQAISTNIADIVNNSNITNDINPTITELSNPVCKCNERFQLIPLNLIVDVLNYVLGRKKTRGSVNQIILFDKASLIKTAKELNSEPHADVKGDKRLTNAGKALTKHWHRDITSNFWIYILQAELKKFLKQLGREEFEKLFAANSVYTMMKTGRLCGNIETINNYSSLVLDYLISPQTVVWVNAYHQQSMVFLELRIAEGYGLRWLVEQTPTLVEPNESQVEAITSTPEESNYTTKLQFRGVVEPQTKDGFLNKYRH